jgi:hypothetical protein
MIASCSVPFQGLVQAASGLLVPLLSVAGQVSGTESATVSPFHAAMPGLYITPVDTPAQTFLRQSITRLASWSYLPQSAHLAQRLPFEIDSVRRT